MMGALHDFLRMFIFIWSNKSTVDVFLDYFHVSFPWLLMLRVDVITMELLNGIMAFRTNTSSGSGEFLPFTQSRVMYLDTKSRKCP